MNMNNIQHTYKRSTVSDYIHTKGGGVVKILFGIATARYYKSEYKQFSTDTLKNIYSHTHRNI